VAPAPAGAVPGVDKTGDTDSKPAEDKEKVEKKTDNDRGEGGPKPEPPPNKPEPKPADIKKDKER